MTDQTKVDLSSIPIMEGIDPIDLNNPEYFTNWQLSQLEFNRRVLAQAVDSNNPLLERLKFLCIFSTNMDEFFEVRVSGLKQKATAKAANSARSS